MNFPNVYEPLLTSIPAKRLRSLMLTYRIIIIIIIIIMMFANYEVLLGHT
jgi:hypothetical protein